MRLAGLLAVALASVALADPPSIETFASRPAIEGASVSPDGHYLATIEPQGGRGRVLIRQRVDGRFQGGQLVMGEPEHFQFTWCQFATNTRLLCGLRGMGIESGLVYAASRLVAVDADGRNMRVLIQNSNDAQGQFQDRVLHWRPGTADSVLVEADEGLIGVSPGASVIGNVGTHGLPAVFELNVVTGAMHVRQRARDPIRHWMADAKGQVRLGWGQQGVVSSYYARLDGDSQWRRLAKFEVFSKDNSFEPIAISRDDPNKAYAFAYSGGRNALWLVDLTDKDDPILVFAEPTVDVDDAVRAADTHLIGVYYETVYPNVFYLDDREQQVAAAVRKAKGGQFTMIEDRTLDEKIYVLRTESDVAPDLFTVFDVESKRLTNIGGPQPGLNSEELPSLQAISYPARDGVEIPGYLTLPRGAVKAHLPLVVMPHGGPIARDGWHYDFLRLFLASRGYAVLQMNFRGSDGYGSKWFYAAHQDWGGKTYDDVVDGAKWAISQGIADPQRVAIVGWSFGGYVALVAAQRQSDLFRCAVSIAGLSDLGMLIDEEAHFINGEVATREIGTNKEKLRRDSPRLHAAEVAMPVLMIHGDHDAQVALAQSEAMNTALAHAGKPHRLVTIKDADHQMSAESARVTLLREIEAFLRQYVPASGGPGAPVTAETSSSR
jgi:dipeptidyl aminopeptidase/acylaminoacyl peptidase